jgi:type I restriction enzyme R subunit
MGDETSMELPGFSSTGDFEKFRAKTRAFLLEHQDNSVIHKLRMNIALTSSDLDELERILSESGVGRKEDIARAKDVSHGLGLFVRSLVGLDREAAKQSLATFLSGKNLMANQIEFINLIINHLTEHGTIDIALLYESPFTDITPYGPDGLFTPDQVNELITALEQITATAVVSPGQQQITA